MNLQRGPALRPGEEPPPPWLPSHVQVAVVQARGLRAKGGPGDAFVALQLGRQKHRTSVATQKGGCPRWAERCALELPPPLLPDPDPDPGPDPLLLQLVVWQRALVGPDRFLGRAAVPLAALLQGGRSHPDRWYRLHSKPGRKEKERGEIQLTIEFTRHSLTASMFDLSVKDKPRSPFRKLKDKVKGRQKYDLESASAIVSSSSGALDEDFDLAGRKDKAKGFFFKRQLRRSSLTRSSMSLGSESTVSSASSLAGLGSAETVAASPGRHSSLSTDPAGRDFLPSPKPSHKRAFSDEVSQISVWPEPQSVQSLQAPKEPSSRSSLCINGSHIYCEEPSPKPSFVSLAPLPPSQGDPGKQDRGSAAGLPAAEPDLPPWPAGGFQKGPPKDPPRFIPSPPILAAQEEDKLSVKTIALNKHRVRVKMEEGLQAESKPVPMAVDPVFPSEVRRLRPQEERERAEAGVFRRENGKGHGRSYEAGSPEPASSLEATAAGEEGPGSASGGGGQIGLRDSREPVRKPSSQPGLPAPPELAKDPCVSADEGLPPSVREPRAQPLAPTASHLEPLPAAAAAPAHPSVEGDDGFDAFAASRLQPAAPGEPPKPTPTVDSPGLPGGAAGLPTRQEGEPPGPVRVPRESPDRLHFVFGDRGWASSGSEGALLARETFGEGGSSAPEASGLQEEEAQGEAARARIAGGPGSSEQMGAVASAVPEEALGWAISPLADPFTEEQDRPAPRSQEQALPGSQPTPEADSGDASWLWWDPEREEEALGLRAEDAAPISCGPAEEVRRMPAQTKVPGGAEPPPPELLRRVSPLGLTEEASGAGWGMPECARPGGPGLEAHQHLPPVGAAGSPPATTASLAPAAIIGAGVHGATEGRGPAAAGDEALEDNELASQEASSGDTLLAVNEGAGGAEHFTTCPSQPSVGRLGLSDTTESPRQGGPQEPGSGPLGLECAWPPGVPGSASLRSLERLPRGALEPSPSLLFWSTLEEQRGLSGGGASLEEPEEQPSSPEQDDASPGPAPCLPPLLEQSGHQDSLGHELELSPGGPSDPAMDFKKASFWQAGKGESSSEHNDLVPTPGNPFAPWAAPSLQNNPFVDVPPDMPWAQATILQVSPIIDAQGLGEFPAAAGPPGQLHSHRFSLEPPVAPSRPGPQPLAFSTPSVQAAPSPADLDLPSPLGHPAAEGAAAVDGLAMAPPFPVLSPPGTDASTPSVLSTETPPEDAPLQQTASPHPVKPMRSTPDPESPCKEKPRQAASRNPVQTAGQEQLTPNPDSSGSSAASVVQLGKTEPKQNPPAKYHHLTREELVQLVLRREAELGKKEEQVRELENYIDRLLVRIMEQSPILLQIPLGEEAEATQ